jgi:hypothetical protein
MIDLWSFLASQITYTRYVEYSQHFSITPIMFLFGTWLVVLYLWVIIALEFGYAHRSFVQQSVRPWTTMSRLWVLSIALVSLAWYLNSLIAPANPPITNFGKCSDLHKPFNIAVTLDCITQKLIVILACQFTLLHAHILYQITKLCICKLYLAHRW